MEIIPSPRKFERIRKCFWRARRKIAIAILPTTLNVVQEKDASDAKLSQPDGVSSGVPSSVREVATGLAESGDLISALSLLRRALRHQPNDSLLWMSYGNRLSEDQQQTAAFVAFTNAVELDPGNFGALEPFVLLAEKYADEVTIRRILEGLTNAIAGKKHRHLDSLSYSIPYGVTSAVKVVAESDDKTARASANLYLTGGGSGDESLEYPDAYVARAVYLLCTHRWEEACRTLARLSDDRIPSATLRLAIRRAKERADLAVMRKLIGHYLRANPGDRWAQKRRRTLGMDAKIKFDPLELQFPFPEIRSSGEHQMDTHKVAYTVYSSLPYHSSGYATRTQGLLGTLRDVGWNVSAYTRLDYPQDLPGYETLDDNLEADVVDGVEYNRLTSQGAYPGRNNILSYVDCYAEVLEEVIRQQGVSIVHAASNYLNGLASIVAARRVGIPSIYEVRGLWEVTRASRDPVWRSSREYRQAVALETQVAEYATHVITITHALKSELISRGVAGEKIWVVPNGVDAERFKPRSRNIDLAESLGLMNKTVIGYAGSIVDYEGLELLIEAAAYLAKERDDFAVLIVGDGKDLSRLRNIVEDLSVSDRVIFCGRVPHHRVEDYMSLFDIAAFPRLGLPVCEMVSPLKPFEAMAMGISVVASDVRALGEIVEDGATGLLHAKDDVRSLKVALMRLLDSPNLRAELGAAGRRWVVGHRNWKTVAAPITTIYENLGAGVQAETRRDKFDL